MKKKYQNALNMDNDDVSVASAVTQKISNTTECGQLDTGSDYVLVSSANMHQIWHTTAFNRNQNEMSENSSHPPVQRNACMRDVHLVVRFVNQYLSPELRNTLSLQMRVLLTTDSDPELRNIIRNTFLQSISSLLNDAGQEARQAFVNTLSAMPSGDLSDVSNPGHILPTTIGCRIGPGADDTSALTEGTKTETRSSTFDADAAPAADNASASTEETQPLPFDADAASLDVLSGLTGLRLALSVASSEIEPEDNADQELYSSVVSASTLSTITTGTWSNRDEVKVVDQALTRMRHELAMNIEVLACTKSNIEMGTFLRTNMLDHVRTLLDDSFHEIVRNFVSILSGSSRNDVKIIAAAFAKNDSAIRDDIDSGSQDRKPAAKKSRKR